ncbi:MAG: PAS domain S-box protein [Candidatus Acidiferrales bacterium]|jgi:PAS domain S-box-containing protein
MEELRIATARALTHGGGRHRLTKHSLPRVLVLLFVCAAFYPFSFAADTRHAKNVLVLYSFSDPRLANSQDALKVPVRRQVHAPVDFEVEYLEAQRFEDLGYEQSLSDTLRHAYANQKFDVIVVDGYPALRFAETHRSEIFPGAPIVFSGVYAGRVQDQKLPPGVTGVTETEDVRGSLELAFRLQPGTKHVALVTGTTEFERYWFGEFHNAFLPFKDKVDLIDLVGLPIDQLMRQALSLPPQTVVFFQIPPQFSTQPVLGTYDVLLAIGQQIPTYCIFAGYCVDHGGIGGSYPDAAEQTAKTAALVSRVLLGEKPENIPVDHDSGARDVVDWRQLRRWNIPESALPAGSLVLYREPSPWQRYRKVIIGGIALLVVQALLICGLLWQRANRRKVQRSLVERLEFESLLSDLSTTFINLPQEQVGANMQTSLGRIAEFLGMDQITLHEFSEDRVKLMVTIFWRADGANTVPGSVEVSWFPWWSNLLLRGEMVLVTDTNTLPAEAAAEREYLRKLDAISIAIVPLKAGGEVFGSISFSSTKRRVLWTEDLVQQLRILAEIFSNARKRERSNEALLASNAELKKSEAVLRESEERFRLVANSAPVLIWMSNADKQRTFVSQAWLEFTGRLMEQEVNDGWAAGVHPHDRDLCLRTYSGAMDARMSFEMEYRLRRSDGEYSLIVDIGVPRFDPDGIFLGHIGSCMDITERKLTEEKLEELTGRLITAQEEERTRIARELHDDFSQRLAMQSIGLEQLCGKFPPSEVEGRATVQQLLTRIQEISFDLHSLSHQLHSSRLEHVGLGSALRGLCEEISEKYRIEVEFAENLHASKIPKDTALCLFRITQEALGNMVKHSGAKRAQVELSATSDEILLRIVDAGVGFDVGLRDSTVGIGLVGMRERLRLVGGKLSIQSAPMRGTEILAEVPLSVSSNDARPPETTTRYGRIKS